MYICVNFQDCKSKSGIKEQLLYLGWRKNMWGSRMKCIWSVVDAQFSNEMHIDIDLRGKIFVNVWKNAYSISRVRNSMRNRFTTVFKKGFIMTRFRQLSVVKFFNINLLLKLTYHLKYYCLFTVLYRVIHEELFYITFVIGFKDHAKIRLQACEKVCFFLKIYEFCTPKLFRIVE